MRIAAFTKYDALAASTRQRFVQYSDHLKYENLSLEIFPLLDQSYLIKRFSKEHIGKFFLLKKYTRRFVDLINRKNFDVLWIHCETFPFLPGIFERIPGWTRRPIVYDFDDAIFHNYDQRSDVFSKLVLANKLDPIVRSARLALCGNQYLANWAGARGVPTEIVPTVVDAQVFKPGAPNNKERVSVGWIGSPTTYPYVEPLRGVLSRVCSSGRARTVIVGSGRLGAEGPLVHVDWTEAGEVQNIQEMDIGIMPLPDTPWTRGKCGYKLIQYMACGLPVIASPVGVNSEIVEHGVNGFLARSEDEWQKALETLIGDPELRERMGRAGRVKVERCYSLQVQGPRVARLLADVARNDRPKFKRKTDDAAVGSV